MGVLAPPIHIKGSSGTNDCIKYIQDPQKIVANEQTMNVMRYMQSHCIEDVASVGYNGCSGVREMAVEQFRMDEAKPSKS